jgi:hypothetical protein
MRLGAQKQVGSGFAIFFTLRLFVTPLRPITKRWNRSYVSEASTPRAAKKQQKHSLEIGKIPAASLRSAFAHLKRRRAALLCCRQERAAAEPCREAIGSHTQRRP